LKLRPLASRRLLLGAIVLAAFYLAVSYAAQASEWAVMTDELQTSKLATSIARTLSPVPRIHGEYYGALGQLYPLLIAPFFGLLSVPGAFTAAHVLNSLLLASSALPAYLLGRAVTGSRAAGCVAAALTAFVPWLVLATTLLTENAAYPAFVWGLWLCYRALAEPSVGRDAAALGGVALVFLARTQLFVLALALPVAALAHELGFAAATAAPGSRLPAVGRAVRRTLAAHPLLAAAYAAGAIVGAILAAFGSLHRVFGNYGETVGGNPFPAGIWHAAAVHFDYVVLGVGVAPFVLASAWSLATVVSPDRREAHVFAVLLLALVPLLTLEAASFDLRFTPGQFVQDRYLCYLAPLFAVGAAAALLDRRRDLLAGLGLALGFAFFWLAGVASYGTDIGIYWASPAAAFHRSLASVADAFGLSLESLVRWGSLVVTFMLVAVLWRGRPRPTLGIVGFAIAAFGAVEAAYVLDRVALPGITRTPAIEGVRRDWIDADIGGGSSVALVPNPRLAPEYWWDAEFWNKSVDRAVSVDGSITMTPFAAARVSIDPRTGTVRGDEPASLLVLDDEETRFGLAGTTPIAEERPLTLVRVARPYRALWLTRGTTPDGWTRPRKAMQIRFFAGTQPGRRRVAITLSAASGVQQPQRFTLRSGATIRRGRVPPGSAVSVSFGACAPRGGFGVATLSTRGAVRLPDERVVGLHLDRIEARATAPSCR
jgi:hypothetical protein